MADQRREFTITCIVVMYVAMKRTTYVLPVKDGKPGIYPGREVDPR